MFYFFTQFLIQEGKSYEVLVTIMLDDLVSMYPVLIEGLNQG